MNWFDILKEKFDYNKKNQFRVIQPKGHSKLDGSDISSVEANPNVEAEWEDAQTGEIVPENTKNTVNFMGWKSAQEAFSKWKAANSKDYYDDVSKILTEYSKTRTALPHRNYMEEAMTVYWTEHLNSLRKLYNTVDKVAQKVEGNNMEERSKAVEDKLIGESGYVLDMIKNIETEDNNALLGER